MGVSPASAKVQNWNYDNSGNWTSTTKTIGNTTTTENRQHSVSDQITQIGNNAATHDAKGNLTAYEINGKEYEVDYDLDNRIIKADIDGDDVEYRYDAFGRRVIRKEGSTKTALIWWANSECAEYKHSSGQASIQNDLFSHPTRLNAVIARAVDGSKSKLQWYHKNYLDHVYAVSDDDGDILEHYRYTAFGEVTIYNATGVQQSTTQINNQILWNTRRRDELTGYYMYKFRHYSAELGRWPSRDPIEESGGINLYAFVENDSVNDWDLLGLLQLNSVDLKKPLRNLNHPKIAALSGKVYNMTLDNGGLIEVWRADDKWHKVNSPANKIGISNHLTWCHGVTFGLDKAPNGPYAISGKEVNEILRGDGWKLIKCTDAKKDDIAIWVDAQRTIHHSAIFEKVVTKKNNNGLISIDGKLTTLTEKRGDEIKKNGVTLSSSAKVYWNLSKARFKCYSKPLIEGQTSCVSPGKYESTLAWN